MLQKLVEWSRTCLPKHLGIEVLSAGEGTLSLRMKVEPYHLANNGYLHAASVVALADTACGWGCRLHLPEGGRDFTTIELKSNFLGTATEGFVRCDATLVHRGRTTHVWDADVFDSAGKRIALFRCTQIILYPKK